MLLVAISHAVVARLAPLVVEVERCRRPVLIISHLSTLQVGSLQERTGMGNRLAHPPFIHPMRASLALLQCTCRFSSLTSGARRLRTARPSMCLRTASLSFARINTDGG